MKVTITMLDEKRDSMIFDENVTEAGPSGTFFKVAQQIEEETTGKSGLITRVGGAMKYTWVPASTIRRVEIVE